MKYLLTPWREKYITGLSKKKKGNECIFCVLQKKEDEEAFILYRGIYNYIVLNLFPYNNGHLLIVPYEHKNSLLKVDDNVLFEMTYLMKSSVEILKKVYNPDGFNMGMNLERISGAGVPEHFHLHIVPRWEGDLNFMPLISEVKLFFEGVEKTYSKLKDKFLKIKPYKNIKEKENFSDNKV